MKKFSILSMALLVMVSCSKDDDDDNGPAPSQKKFKVTIENVFEAKDYQAVGTTGAIAPGSNASFTFNAGKGSYLSFATMFVQSNDLFYAPGEGGIALYDNMGNALTGDITSMVDLWDAGTEVNQEPGVGADQAPRQSGPNTGAAENGNVQLLSAVNDGYTYPMNNEVINVSLAHNGGTEFTVTISNVSDMGSFATPLAPGVWVVHGMGTPLFMDNMMASMGIEAMAEDGNNMILDNELMPKTGYVSPFAPGVYAVHSASSMPLFVDGQPDAGDGLEGLSEDGTPGNLNMALESNSDVSAHGIFNTPAGASAAGPLFPGGTYEFEFTANDGDYFNFATMLVQTNDLFFAFGDGGIALYDNGSPVTGDVTSMVSLWDAGTEVNEFPGAGNYQAPRQNGANMGMDESGNVRINNDGYTYPAVSDMIKVTISYE